MRRLYPMIAVLTALSAAASTAAASDAVRLEQDAQDVRVEIGGKPFTVYHFAGADKPPFVRPFFYPVLAADGVEVTSDQIRTNPKEHPHHRSIWVGHGDVNGLDHWSFQQKPAPPKQRHLKFDKLEGDTIVEELVWDDLEGKPLVREKRTIRFVPYDDGSRGIDLAVALTAPQDKDVTLADTKEAGLCAVRVAKQISDHPTLINSAGAEGEKAVWGKPADWADESGTIDGKPYGIAIFDHPANPRHPTPWHAREYGLVAPNEFGLHAFDKKANPAHAGDFKIRAGQTATFRYRVVVHEGDAQRAKLGEKYRAFASEP